MPLAFSNLKTLRAFTASELKNRLKELEPIRGQVLGLALSPSAPEYQNLFEFPVIRQTGILEWQVWIYVRGEEQYFVPRENSKVTPVENMPEDDFGGVVVPDEKKRGRPSLRPEIEKQKKLIEQENEQKGKRKRGRPRKSASPTVGA